MVMGRFSESPRVRVRATSPLVNTGSDLDVVLGLDPTAPIHGGSFVGPYTNGVWAGGTHPALWRTSIPQDTVGKYALMSDNASTYLNALAGGAVSLMNNHAEVAVAGSAGLAVAASKHLGAASGYTTGPWMGGAGYAGLWKTSVAQSDVTKYVLISDSAGNSFLNAAAGGALCLRVANSDVLSVAGAQVTVPAPIIVLLGNALVTNPSRQSVSIDPAALNGGANAPSYSLQFGGQSSNTAIFSNRAGTIADKTDIQGLSFFTANALRGYFQNNGLFMARLGLRAGNASTPETHFASLGHSGVGGNTHLDSFGAGQIYLNWGGGTGGGVTIGNGASGFGTVVAQSFNCQVAGGIVNGGRVIGRGTAPGVQDQTGGIFVDDLYTYRSAAARTGVLYLGLPLDKYFYFDGATYIMAGASLNVNGTVYPSAGWAKESVAPLARGLDAVRAVAPRRFRWREGQGPGGEQAGFVREEVARALPGSVTDDTTGANGETIPGGYRGDHLVAYLWQAVRELAAEVDQLKVKAA